MNQFGLMTFLNVKRGTDKGLSSSEAFKSALLGQMLAGDNVTANFLLTDRLISRELPSNTTDNTGTPTTTPDNCVSVEDCNAGLRLLTSQITQLVRKRGGKQSEELVRQIGQLFTGGCEAICTRPAEDDSAAEGATQPVSTENEGSEQAK